MKKYKVKLLTPKENAYQKLVLVVCLMMIEDQGMEVSVFDASGGNNNVENIQFFEELNDFAEEESMKFFPKVYDTSNKKGTSIVFHITTEHSHIKWRKLREKEKLIQDLKLYIESTSWSLRKCRLLALLYRNIQK
jgi:cyclopropane fatty-acyl-phospholipid synthase-like methyltransferase